MTGPAPASRWWWALAALAAAGLGGYLRLAHYLEARALWLDEAMLSLNIASHSLGELLRPPLDYHQVAPPLFLALERLAVKVGGVNELSLRAFPIVAGVLVVPLTWLAARRLLGNAEAVLATTLAAVSPLLIRYSNEVKPYGADALTTVVLLVMTLRLVEEPSRRRWLGLLIVGVGALTLSLSAVFVCAGIVGSLLLHQLIRAGHLGWILRLGFGWALAIGLVYLLFYRAGAENPFQHQGYEGAFLLPNAELTTRLLRGLRGTLLSPFLASYKGPGWQLWLVGAATVTGLVVVARRRGDWAVALLTLPVIASALASSLRRYPFGVPRLMVFAGPLVLLAVVGIFTAIARTVRSWSLGSPLLLAASAGVVLVTMGRVAWVGAQEPLRFQDTPRLVEDFQNRRDVITTVYVSARGIPAWLFYTTRWDRLDGRERERLRLYAREATWGRCFENAPSRGRPVVNEGFDLVYQHRQRTEILGVPTGRQWRFPGWVSPTPDEGWAANEAERIARQADPCAWVFFAQLSEWGHKRVMWHLRDNHGATKHYQRYAGGVVLWRFCMPSKPAAEAERGSSPAAAGESTDGA